MCVGPISESDFFTWEALICGPKDTPFVSRHPARWYRLVPVLFHFFLKFSISLSGRRCIRSQTDIRAPASMLIPRHPYTVNFIFLFSLFTFLSSFVLLLLLQPPDYPLSPFKMKFEPPLFHPNSKLGDSFFPGPSTSLFGFFLNEIMPRY